MDEFDDILPRPDRREAAQVSANEIYANLADNAQAFKPRLQLYGLLCELHPALRLAHETYQSLPDKDSADALAKLNRLAIDICAKFYTMSGADRQKLYDELFAKVLKPLLNTLGTKIGSELGQVATSLTQRTGISEALIREEMQIALVEIPGLLDAAYDDFLRVTADILDISDDKLEMLLEERGYSKTATPLFEKKVRRQSKSARRPRANRKPRG